MLMAAICTMAVMLTQERGHHDGETDSGTVVTNSDPTGDVESSETEHRGGVAVLSALAYLRYTVYFCLGFGPTGWIVMATSRSPANSLIWAIPAGGVAFVLAYAFFRLQRSDTDSSLHSKELHTRERDRTYSTFAQNDGKSTGTSGYDHY